MGKGQISWVRHVRSLLQKRNPIRTCIPLQKIKKERKLHHYIIPTFTYLKSPSLPLTHVTNPSLPPSFFF
ncbi:hypothetical protein MANES_02G066350v8 [Manihot esculenta]|uniref:Uncharacterized protein n=1 Tax=Manihot esculenta TaxID=3983 RepID=A0ACB7I5E2_MANES|nr:hypothetical protein MANES_02G066350v8 [Manihot esculenta]